MSRPVPVENLEPKAIDAPCWKKLKQLKQPHSRLMEDRSLVETSATLLVTGALLVVTMFAIRNNKLLGTSATLVVTSALLVVTRSY